MADKRINELSISKSVPGLTDIIAVDTPIVNQGETYKLTIQDLAIALSGGILTGDMLKSTYDIDGDGVVGAAHQLFHDDEVYVKKSANDVIIQSQFGIISIVASISDIYMTANGGAGKLFLNSKEVLTNDHLLTTNPHNVTKDDVGLGDVDNTSDLAKPVSIVQGQEFIQYVKRDGSYDMYGGYTPNNALSVATKSYVDSKVSGTGTTTYVVLTEAAMVADLSYLVVGDRCVVTSDPDPSKNGDYVCNTAWPVVAPNEIGIWTKVAVAGGDLLADGSVPMTDPYSPTGDFDIATKQYTDTKLNPLGTISMDAGYTPTGGTDIATVQYVNDKAQINADAITALKTQYDTYTWTIKGAVVDADYIIPMFLSIPVGETWVISKAIHKAGTGAGELNMQQNGITLAPYGGMQFSTGKSSTAGDSIALTDEAELAPSFALTAATDVAITIQIKKTRS